MRRPRHPARTLGGVLAALGLAALLAGCAAPAAAPPAAAWFDDAAFAPPSQPVGSAGLLALSAPMQRFLDTEVAAQVRRKGAARALVDTLYLDGPLRIVYDDSRTRSAAEAFEERAGNCLSLVLMTAAFAKALDLEVTYQTAEVDESWRRSGGLLLVSGHVNLRLDRLRPGPRGSDPQGLTVDFLPPEQLRGLRVRPIAERTVFAMFMNNRAAEALLRGALADAYWWARAAVLADPGFGAALNTLAVVHLRHGDAARADTALASLLVREPTHRPALHNRIQALQQLGRAPEVALLQQRLAVLEAAPPYHWFDLGRAALDRGDAAAARALFERELARAPGEPEFHFWLALALDRLGEAALARRQLALAAEASRTPAEQERYAGKLSRLRAAPSP